MILYIIKMKFQNLVLLSISFAAFLFLFYVKVCVKIFCYVDMDVPTFRNHLNGLSGWKWRKTSK